MPEQLIEAIENGKIVRVSEQYALHEGLLIIRKRQNVLGFAANPEAAKAIKAISVGAARTKPYYLKNDILSGLKENFHWELQHQRRLRNLSRQQVAKMCGLTTDEVSALERGEMPGNFIALSKLETFYGVNVRK